MSCIGVVGRDLERGWFVEEELGEAGDSENGSDDGGGPLDDQPGAALGAGADEGGEAGSVEEGDAGEIEQGPARVAVAVRCDSSREFAGVGVVEFAGRAEGRSVL